MPHEMLTQTEGNELPNDTSNWAKVNPDDYPPHALLTHRQKL